MCSKIYKLEHGKKALKITKLKVDLSTDIDMLLMVEKILREEYVFLFIVMQHLLKNTWKIMIKIKNHIFNIEMQIVYMVRQFQKSFQ